MKKISLLILITVTTSFSTPDVFICVSPGAKKYHYTEKCRGLSSCKHEIKKVSKTAAQEKGLELCGWED